MPELMYLCELMVKIICKASNLKSDNFKYRNEVGCNSVLYVT